MKNTRLVFILGLAIILSAAVSNIENLTAPVKEFMQVQVKGSQKQHGES